VNIKNGSISSFVLCSIASALIANARIFRCIWSYGGVCPHHHRLAPRNRDGRGHPRGDVYVLNAPILAALHLTGRDRGGGVITRRSSIRGQLIAYPWRAQASPLTLAAVVYFVTRLHAAIAARWMRRAS
jgi:hypothetical protein